MSQPLYRNDLIEARMGQKFPGLSKEQVAQRMKRRGKDRRVCLQTIERILARENVSLRKLKTFTDFLDIVWHETFNPDLTPDQFHRAVLANGDRDSVR